jgi:hypothetical protein
MIKKYVAFKDICELESQISWDILSYGPVWFVFLLFSYSYAQCYKKKMCLAYQKKKKANLSHKQRKEHPFLSSHMNYTGNTVTELQRKQTKLGPWEQKDSEWSFQRAERVQRELWEH